MKGSKSFLAFIVIGILGTLWHFIYEWSDYNQIIGFIAPVNESTWEHLKILFFPALIYYVIECFVRKENPKKIIPATVISVIAGMLAILASFYTYTGILGFNIGIIDISTFFIGLIIMLIVKSKILKQDIFKSGCSVIISIIIAIILIVLFCIWTYNPPSIALFVSP